MIDAQKQTEHEPKEAATLFIRLIIVLSCYSVCRFVLHARSIKAKLTDNQHHHMLTIQIKVLKLMFMINTRTNLVASDFMAIESQ